MNMTQIILAAQAQGGGSMSFIIMMVAIFAIMYFFMIKPQQKRQKEIQNFQNSLTEGAEVITGGHPSFLRYLPTFTSLPPA